MQLKWLFIVYMKEDTSSSVIDFVYHSCHGFVKQSSSITQLPTRMFLLYNC
jgi:hypothetical protein